MKPIGSYVIANDHAIHIYEVDSSEGRILIGSSTEKPYWTDIVTAEDDPETNAFYWGEILIPLNECVRVPL